MAEITDNTGAASSGSTTFDSNSSLSELRDGYADNASFEQSGSTSKAQAFITVCIILLLRLNKRAQHGSNEEFEFDTALVQGELDRARSWMAANNTSGGSYKFNSFASFGR